MTEQHPSPSPAPRRRLRAALRWTVATAVFLAAGGGTAFAVAHLNRADVPGLKGVPSDGRYVYPALRLPELPPGASGPDEGGAPDAQPGIGLPHAIPDVRQLLLPTAVGGKPDPRLPGEKGWVAADSYAKLFQSPAREAQVLRENGARQVAATGWTMPDGTRVAVYLVPFRSSESAQSVYTAEYWSGFLAQAPGTPFGTAVPWLSEASAQSMAEPAKPGAPAVRAAVFNRNEIVGLLVMTNPKQVNQVDFRQALILQTDLLGG